MQTEPSARSAPHSGGGSKGMLLPCAPKQPTLSQRAVLAPHLEAREMLHSPTQKGRSRPRRLPGVVCLLGWYPDFHGKATLICWINKDQKVLR